MKREDGQGSITRLPDGRLWVRGPLQADGTRPSLGYAATEEQANRILLNGLHELRTAKRTGQTFAKFAEGVLDAREHAGIRGIDEERKVFAVHLEHACFAQMPIDRVSPTDIAEWLRAMGKKKAKDRRGHRLLSRGTILRALTVASAIFDAAGPQGSGLLDSNPCIGMKVRKVEHKTEEPWTFLTFEEQELVRLGPIAEADRLAVLFAIGTGLRQGEQFNLELRDLHVDDPEPRVVVRFGSKGKAPKNGKIRTVPLFGIALEAARAWLRLLPTFCPNNFARLVFPTMTGSRRQVGKPLGNGAWVSDGKRTSTRPKSGGVWVDRLSEVLVLCGIRRDCRWHDLRHTTASSLVGGFWGDPWTLEEVKDMLGHSSIIVTQRYAHLGETALKKAAKKVRPVGGSLVDGGGPTPSSIAAISNDIAEAPPARVELATNALGTGSIVDILRALATKNGQSNQLVTNLAETLATLLDKVPS